MKKSIILFLAIAIIVVTASAFIKQGSTVKGWVTPKEAGVAAWAISQKDTFKTHITTEGTFEIFNVKAGNYTVVIQAASPYKTAQKESVVVTEGSIVDVGEIKLDK